ncbi:S-layer domain protein [Peptoclostridium acidaminophilum DSM 3953]|uniref:S-layer domain protein n=1 Tax=Peptoclostridium acidaminophilum DSM 3953 TaxID=1286171 RepID=W8TM00_PEPAC|nr:S-layer homology domain-containing protein [Peptoclostridium acidaminophilum]AHM57207.1 S-layer domain protein [Peptoclostridium acidaminophilum DSM 3953]
MNIKRIVSAALVGVMISGGAMAYAAGPQMGSIQGAINEAKKEGNAQYRETIRETFRLYMDKENPDVEGLQNAVRLQLTEQLRNMAIEAGYDPDEIVAQLVILKAMTGEDVDALMEAMEAEDYDAIRDIALKYYELSKQMNYRFKDMNNHWAENTVAKLAGGGIISGRDDVTYDPEGTVTRAEFVALLVRGLEMTMPEGAKSPDFTDVAKGDWHYAYVMTAYANGIVEGLDADTFNPDGKITREQMVKMMVDALKLQDMDMDQDQIRDRTQIYKDWDTVSEWARERMEKALMLGLIKGKQADRIAPAETATRAEAATIVERLLEAQ